MGRAEIITADQRGRHNSDLVTATNRFTHGSSWKKCRTIMLVPAGAFVPSRVVLSWMGLVSPPNQGFVRWLLKGMEVGDAYSTAIEEILRHPDLSQWEYVLTLEHDNAPPYDGLVRLIERMENNPRFACIGGLYWTKGEGGVPQIWGDAKDPVINYRPQPPDPGGGLVECCGTGMGFNLFRLSMFKDARIERPLFKTLTGIEGRGVGTQDLTFWSKARPLGYRCAIDCSVRVGHFDTETEVMW